MSYLEADCGMRFDTRAELAEHKAICDECRLASIARKVRR